MKVFQVTRPGSYAAQPGPPDKDARLLFYHLETNYTEANLSLNWFQEAMTELGPYMRLEPDEKKATGIPRQFVMRSVYLYAKSFLYALDSFLSTLQAISKMPDFKVRADTALTAIATKFPKLRDVRNSAHHMEERLLGLKSYGKPITNIQAVERPGMIASAGVKVHDSLSGNTYGTLLADGSFGEVEVTDESMIELQNIYQTLLDTFPQVDHRGMPEWRSDIIS